MLQNLEFLFFEKSDLFRKKEQVLLTKCSTPPLFDYLDGWKQSVQNTWWIFVIRFKNLQQLYPSNFASDRFDRMSADHFNWHFFPKKSSYLTTFYIDFQKAFNKVSHDLLLEKLSALGIGGNCLSLPRSYLSLRKQTMRINSTTSKELDVFSGVTEASFLGQLFFLVFIKDLPYCVMSKAFGYADDYKIVGTNPVTLNIDVRKLWRWCEDNLMSMNLTKSKLLCIKGSAEISLPNYTFESNRLKIWAALLLTL